MTARGVITAAAIAAALAAIAPTPPAAAAPVPPAQRCGAPNRAANVFIIRTADGVRLDAAEVGSGLKGIVLVHESGAQALCGWWPFAVHLADMGFHVLLFDLRCYGVSGCPRVAKRDDFVADVAAAAAKLRSLGAASVEVVGASMGGSVALVSGARVSHLAAVADLSGDELSRRFGRKGHRLTAVQAARRLRLPVLFAVAKQDPFVHVAAVRSLYRHVRARGKVLSILPATEGHGWDLLQRSDGSGSWSAFAGTLIQFLQANVRLPSLDGCVHTDGNTSIVRFAATRRDSLSAAVLGSGTAGVVLSNQSDRNLCGWVPFARTLAAAGYHVLLYDYGAGGPDVEAAAAAAELQRLGARKITLAGASEGAKASIIAAARPATPAVGVISLSAERFLGGTDVMPAARTLSRPALFVTAHDDPYSENDTPALYAACPAADKKLVVVPGQAHGVDLLSGATSDQVRGSILSFLAARG
jgi:pimeloyl-ACP methyl ester carboxylesterase